MTSCSARVVKEDGADPYDRKPCPAPATIWCQPARQALCPDHAHAPHMTGISILHGRDIEAHHPIDQRPNRT